MAEQKTKAYTYRMDTDLMERLKDFAWWERRTITEVLDEAVRGYLKDKKVKPRERRA